MCCNILRVCCNGMRFGNTITRLYWTACGKRGVCCRVRKTITWKKFYWYDMKGNAWAVQKSIATKFRNVAFCVTDDQVSSYFEPRSRRYWITFCPHRQIKSKKNGLTHPSFWGSISSCLVRVVFTCKKQPRSIWIYKPGDGLFIAHWYSLQRIHIKKPILRTTADKKTYRSWT